MHETNGNTKGHHGHHSSTETAPAHNTKAHPTRGEASESVETHAHTTTANTATTDTAATTATVTSSGSTGPIAGLPPAERVSMMQEIEADTAALMAKVKRLPLLTAEQRQHSSGKFASQGDTVATGVILAMETAPAVFLMKKNGITTAPDAAGAHADLTCRGLAKSIASNLVVINQCTADSALFFGARVREVTTGSAYDLAVGVGKRNEDVAQYMTPAVDAAAQPARTRKNNQRNAARKAKDDQAAAPKGTPKGTIDGEQKAAPADATQGDSTASTNEPPASK